MWRKRLGWKGLWREFERDYFIGTVFIQVARRRVASDRAVYQSESICGACASEFAEVSTGQTSDHKLGYGKCSAIKLGRTN